MANKDYSQPVQHTKLPRWLKSVQTPLLVVMLLAVCYMAFVIGQRSVNGGTPIIVPWGRQ